MENVKEYLKKNLKIELVTERTFPNPGLYIYLTLENEEIAKCHLEDLVYLIEDTIDDTVERSVEDITKDYIEDTEERINDLEDRIQNLEDSIEEDKA